MQVQVHQHLIISKNYYCVKADVGFRNINDRATYNLSYDLVNEKSENAALDC